MNNTDSSDSWFQEEDEPCFSSCESNMMTPRRGAGVCDAEGSTSNHARSNAISHFTAMGFAEDLVIKTVDESGEETPDTILETLLAYTAPEECSPRGENALSYPNSPDIDWDSSDDLSDFSPIDSAAIVAPEECSPRGENALSYPNSPDIDWDSSDDLSDFSDADSYHQNEEKLEPSPETKMIQLVEMGFSAEEVSAAIDLCDPDTCVAELMDYISAAQMAETTSDHLCELPLDTHGPPDVKKKKLVEQEYQRGRMIRAWRINRKVEMEKRKRHSSPDEEEASIKIPKVMIGFGIPSHPRKGLERRLPDIAVGPPFFYFENVALAPKGVWSAISRSLFNIEPEFVDSKHFCAAARKRGYIHNLPIQNRFPLLPIPPLTIKEALPLTSRWWPSWDVRSQLNCLLTCIGSAQTTERIRKELECCRGGDPPENIRKYVLEQCRKFNFVWTGKNRVAPLDPEEMELILGYPRYHTRGGGTSQTERYKVLGNTFQVNTVAYHLSVLKNLFPSGISVLSLFSGIGGGEIALHRLGIQLNFVVAVEISAVSRHIFKGWWEGTGQQGILIDDITDVKELTTEKLEKLVNLYGGFDLIIGGSPCNNLTGSNRWHRDGLEGSHSILFFDFCRILKTVIRLMRENKQQQI